MSHATFALGILTAPPPLTALSGERSYAPPEPQLCSDMLKAAAALSIDAFVFTPDDYHMRIGLLQGSQLVDGLWERKPVPLPDIIYDRSFCRSSEQQARRAVVLTAMRAKHPHQLMNSKLPGKLQVYQCLLEAPPLSTHLPRTELFTISELDANLLAFEGELVLKPAAGMQGRGLLHIKRNPLGSELIVVGRTRSNQSFTRSFQHLSELSLWLKRFIGRSPFLVQPYLSLRDADHRPYDIRVLQQKDRNGQWQLTGMAARHGSKGALTSNLHGGGEAIQASSILSNNFGKLKTEHLLRQIHTISRHTVKRLEQSFGRFGELALDFGLDFYGKVWLLEVNSKPGRDVFRQIGDTSAQRLSVERPLHYARFLMDRKSPTFATTKSALAHQHSIKPILVGSGPQTFRRFIDEFDNL